jgi:hypothetical protein
MGSGTGPRAGGIGAGRLSFVPNCVIKRSLVDAGSVLALCSLSLCTLFTGLGLLRSESVRASGIVSLRCVRANVLLLITFFNYQYCATVVFCAAFVATHELTDGVSSMDVRH